MVDEGRVVSGEALAQIRAGRNVCGWHDGSDVTFPADASLPLVPPSVLAHDLNERRALWGDHWERCSRSRVLDVPGPLINGSPTVVRERLSVGDAQLRARNFMLRWLVCARCNAAFNPEQFRYWNVQPDDDEISRDAWYPRAAVQRPPDHHFKQLPQAFCATFWKRGMLDAGSRRLWWIGTGRHREILQSRGESSTTTAPQSMMRLRDSYGAACIH
jgi:hypothetical protein